MEGVMMDGIPDDEYNRSGCRRGTVRARIPVAQLFRDAVIEGDVTASSQPTADGV